MVRGREIVAAEREGVLVPAVSPGALVELVLEACDALPAAEVLDELLAELLAELLEDELVDELLDDLPVGQIMGLPGWTPPPSA